MRTENYDTKIRKLEEKKEKAIVRAKKRVLEDFIEDHRGEQIVIRSRCYSETYDAPYDAIGTRYCTEYEVYLVGEKIYGSEWQSNVTEFINKTFAKDKYEKAQNRIKRAELVLEKAQQALNKAQADSSEIMADNVVNKAK